MSLTIHSKCNVIILLYRGQKFHFCRLPFAVSVMLNLSNASTLRLKNLITRSFTFPVRPCIKLNPSRKGRFSKTLFKSEELKNASWCFVFYISSCWQKAFWKRSFPKRSLRAGSRSSTSAHGVAASAKSSGERNKHWQIQNERWLAFSNFSGVVWMKNTRWVSEWNHRLQLKFLRRSVA